MRNNQSMVDPTDYTKEELATAVGRLRATAKRYKDKAKEGAEEFMAIALEGGAAFGVGWWIGSIKAGGSYTEEDLQWFGMDKELVIGIGLLAAGLSGFLGRQMGGAAKAMGKGVLAYWAGTQGEAIGAEG